MIDDLITLQLKVSPYKKEGQSDSENELQMRFMRAQKDTTHIPKELVEIAFIPDKNANMVILNVMKWVKSQVVMKKQKELST